MIQYYIGEVSVNGCIFAKNTAMSDFVITIKETGDEAFLSFESNLALTSGKEYEFRNIDAAKPSPLAQQLFYLPFIKKVVLTENAVVLERFNIVSWDEVKNEVAQQLVDYLNSGAPVIHEPEELPPGAITMYAEVTPNPEVMKFVANKLIVPGMYEFKSVEEATDEGLAKALFELPFVKSVFMDQNYVSVTKQESADWNEITMELRDFIREYIAGGKKIVTGDPNVGIAQTGSDSAQGISDPVSQKIIEILEDYVKPAVASDGGNILFESYEPESKTVHVILQGACSGCPSSTYTLKNGIEQMLKNMLGDEVREVVALNG